MDSFVLTVSAKHSCLILRVEGQPKCANSSNVSMYLGRSFDLQDSFGPEGATDDGQGRSVV